MPRNAMLLKTALFWTLVCFDWGTKNPNKKRSSTTFNWCLCVLYPLSPQDTLYQPRRTLLLPLGKPPTRATDLVTHTRPYGTTRTRLHTVIRGMVPDSVLCCRVGPAVWFFSWCERVGGTVSTHRYYQFLFLSEAEASADVTILALLLFWGSLICLLWLRVTPWLCLESTQRSLQINKLSHTLCRFHLWPSGPLLEPLSLLCRNACSGTVRNDFQWMASSALYQYISKGKILELDLTTCRILPACG